MNYEILQNDKISIEACMHLADLQIKWAIKLVRIFIFEISSPEEFN